MQANEPNESPNQLTSSKDKIDNSNKKKPKQRAISRRAFLGVSAGAATFAAIYTITKRPEVRLVLPPQDLAEEIITEEWIATSCLNCSTRCATKVRVVNGKAVRIATNPLSEFSEGETCPRSHIGLQVLYDPDRVEGPLKRTNPEK